ncbi:hypothetical protein PFMALIP_00694 [Plasmodium falciparum MaliPS096_E11]|uniref:Orn/Lys/Arg decarboxylase C-terminal domain-containing protein n=1 Tax=Plasmodium falciparum MaliPS096_E11 TaxID=1036727 RepID=A0A024WX25_PLAFA|nr:hypothetical protein PFMALIP_00694 [Plasmodium falciparum MaliPS096_E11]
MSEDNSPNNIHTNLQKSNMKLLNDNNIEVGRILESSNCFKYSHNVNMCNVLINNSSYRNNSDNKKDGSEKRYVYDEYNESVKEYSPNDDTNYDATYKGYVNGHVNVNMNNLMNGDNKCDWYDTNDCDDNKNIYCDKANNIYYYGNNYKSKEEKRKKANYGSVNSICCDSTYCMDTSDDNLSSNECSSYIDNNNNNNNNNNINNNSNNNNSCSGDMKNFLEYFERSWLSEDEFVLDPTRITLFTGYSGIDGDTFKVKWLMDKYGIQINKTSINSVLFQTNIGTTGSSCLFLKSCLSLISQELDQKKSLFNERDLNQFNESVYNLVYNYIDLSVFSAFHPLFKKRYEDKNIFNNEGDLRKAFYLAYEEDYVEYILLNNLKDRIRHKEMIVAASFIIPYPPGFPVLVPGQIISEEIVNYLSGLSVKEIHGYDENIGFRCFYNFILDYYETININDPYSMYQPMDKRLYEQLKEKYLHSKKDLHDHRLSNLYMYDKETMKMKKVYIHNNGSYSVDPYGYISDLNEEEGVIINAQHVNNKKDIFFHNKRENKIHNNNNNNNNKKTHVNNKSDVMIIIPSEDHLNPHIIHKMSDNNRKIINTKNYNNIINYTSNILNNKQDHAFYNSGSPRTSVCSNHKNINTNGMFNNLMHKNDERGNNKSMSKHEKNNHSLYLTNGVNTKSHKKMYIESYNPKGDRELDFQNKSTMYNNMDDVAYHGKHYHSVKKDIINNDTSLKENRYNKNIMSCKTNNNTGTNSKNERKKKKSFGIHMSLSPNNNHLKGHDTSRYSDSTSICEDNINDDNIDDTGHKKMDAIDGHNIRNKKSDIKEILYNNNDNDIYGNACDVIACKENMYINEKDSYSDVVLIKRNNKINKNDGNYYYHNNFSNNSKHSNVVPILNKGNVLLNNTNVKKNDYCVIQKDNKIMSRNNMNTKYASSNEYNKKKEEGAYYSDSSKNIHDNLFLKRKENENIEHITKDVMKKPLIGYNKEEIKKINEFLKINRRIADEHMGDIQIKLDEEILERKEEDMYDNKNDMFNVNIKSNIEDVADNSPQMNIDKKDIIVLASNNNYCDINNNNNNNNCNYVKKCETNKCDIYITKDNLEEIQKTNMNIKKDVEHDIGEYNFDSVINQSVNNNINILIDKYNCNNIKKLNNSNICENNNLLSNDNNYIVNHKVYSSIENTNTLNCNNIKTDNNSNNNNNNMPYKENKVRGLIICENDINKNTGRQLNTLNNNSYINNLITNVDDDTFVHREGNFFLQCEFTNSDINCNMYEMETSLNNICTNLGGVIIKNNMEYDDCETKHK